MGNSTWYILIAAVLFVIIFIYIQLRESMNRKKAETGEDKARLRKAVDRVLNGEYGYRVAYAHWEKVEHMGRRTRTTYYTYALAFDASRLWIMPLRYEKGEVVPAEPLLLTSQMLGIAKMDASVDKSGSLRRVSISLHDKDGKEFLTCYVDAVNLREDRFHHFNLLQPEECEQFQSFMATFAAQVTQQNQGLEERVQEEEAAARGGRAKKLAIIGIVAGLLFPLAGFVVGVIAAVTAPKPRLTGGRVTAPLALSILSVAVSLIALIVQTMILAGL